MQSWGVRRCAVSFHSEFTPLVANATPLEQADETWLAEFAKKIKTPWDFTAIHVNKNSLDGVKKDIVSRAYLIVAPLSDEMPLRTTMQSMASRSGSLSSPASPTIPASSRVLTRRKSTSSFKISFLTSSPMPTYTPTVTAMAWALVAFGP